MIKFISDLHLERKRGLVRFHKKQLGGNLFLAGDIGSPLRLNFWDFMDYVSSNFENIFYITGNHEYWNDKYTIKEIDNIIEDYLLKYSNIQFLNNKKTKLYNYNILGSTLWSNSKNNMSYNFQKIYYKSNIKLNKEIVNNIYYKNVKWIKNNLHKKPTILLTHHLPSYKFTFFNSKYDIFRSHFASDLEYLIKDPLKYGYLDIHMIIL